MQPGLFTETCTLQKKKIGAGPDLSLPKKPHLGHQALPEAVTRHRQLNYSCLLCGRTGVEGLLACAKDPGADLGMEGTEGHI